MKQNNTRKNLILVCISQLVTIVSGLIIPRVILNQFGSEVNGLTGSINQFLSYISLIEGGLGSVYLSKLYKPLAQKDDKKLSRIVSAAKGYFKSLSIIFILYALVLATLYPLIVKSSFDYLYCFTLVLILGINLFVQYCFCITYKLLLQADQKAYVPLFVQTMISIVNIVITILVSHYCQSIHIVKFICALVYLLQPIVFKTYVTKSYKLKKVHADKNEVFPERWSCFGQNVAAFIHNNTDVTILTLLANLYYVSIYSVHTLVTAGIKGFITTLSQAFSPQVGHALAEGDSATIEKRIETYEVVSYFASTVLFGCCLCLINPFVQLYTIKVTDISYYSPLFAFLIILSEYFYCIKNPYLSVTYSAGKFRETAWAAYTEAAVNIVISIVLVLKFQLVGVAVGTLSAMVFRFLYQILYLKSHIVERSIKLPLKRFFISFITLLGCFAISRLFVIEVTTWLRWLIMGLLCFGMYVVTYSILLLLFDRAVIVRLLHSANNKKRMKI